MFFIHFFLSIRYSVLQITILISINKNKCINLLIKYQEELNICVSSVDCSAVVFNLKIIIFTTWYLRNSTGDDSFNSRFINVKYFLRCLLFILNTHR